MVINSHSKIIYNDIWFKILGCIAISEIIDSVGRSETIFSRLGSIHFYTDLLGGFVIAFLIWEYVRVVIRKLDKQYDWLRNPVQRISRQLLFGILIPALLSFVFTLIFMRLAYDQDIFETSWIYNEFYAVVLIIILINVVYFAWYMLIAIREQSNKEVRIPVAVVPASERFIEVKKGDRVILLSHTDVSHVVLEGDYSFIKTYDERSFVTNLTLDDIFSQLGDSLFFRANRQVIISRKACKAYQSIENGKINIEIEAKTKTNITVSQKKAREFRKWISKSLL